MPVPLSILDLATAARDQTVAQALEGTVALARKAEETGYGRVWYAEHHNMASIASSATAVLIAHVAAHTSTIRLGAGGIMLPNHAPLVIAEPRCADRVSRVILGRFDGVVDVVSG